MKFCATFCKLSFHNLALKLYNGTLQANSFDGR